MINERKEAELVTGFLIKLEYLGKKSYQMEYIGGKSYFPLDKLSELKDLFIKAIEKLDGR